jgi:hypothetical protein
LRSTMRATSRENAEKVVRPPSNPVVKKISIPDPGQ